MGLPRIQVLPSDIQYYSQQVTSPVTFFSTFETIINTETDANEYDIIPLEELEVGMVTEVSTTTEDSDVTAENLYLTAEDSDVTAENLYLTAEDSDLTVDDFDLAEVEINEHPAIIPVEVECEYNGSENETETCDLEAQTYSVDEGSYTADILSEVVSSSFHEQNHENPDSTCENYNVNLDINSGNLNELVADVCGDDLVFAWLSSLDESSTISAVDFESLVLPTTPVNKNANDVGLAKDELRSFLLSRKTRNNVVQVQEQEHFEITRSRHSRREDVGGAWKRTKFSDSDSEEVSRHRRRQERNRIAARKCRQKRTTLADELTKESEELKKNNEELTSEVRDLTRELRKLENFVLDHDLHMGSFQCHEHMSALLVSHLPELL